jgi:hypothetical protein
LATLRRPRLSADGLAVWREEPGPLRLGEQGSNVAVLGWSRSDGNDAPWFSVVLPSDVALPTDPVLVLSIADSGLPPPGAEAAAHGPVDLTVELIGVDGELWHVALGELGGIPAGPRKGKDT